MRKRSLRPISQAWEDAVRRTEAFVVDAAMNWYEAQKRSLATKQADQLHGLCAELERVRLIAAGHGSNPDA